VQRGREGGRVTLSRARQAIDEVLGQDAGILGEHGEEQPIEEVRHGVRVMAAGAEGRRQVGEVLRARSVSSSRRRVGRRLSGSVKTARRMRNGSPGSAARSSRLKR